MDLSRYDTDKPPGYLAQYEREFAGLFERPTTLLEIGVQRGGSMLLFRDLFPNGTIAGLDLNDIPIADSSGRIHVYRGFQQDPDVLDRIAAEIAPAGFDIIIDDASHVGQYTEATFWHLFPKHLKPGGIYVLDDWACGYWPHWADGGRYSGVAAFRGTSAEVAPVADTRPSTLEGTQRAIRSAARPIAARLERRPVLRSKLARAYMKIEGGTLQRHFPSHDYGMVGFVKQVIDACAVDVLRAKPGEGIAPDSVAIIDSVRVTPSQVFIRKRL